MIQQAVYKTVIYFLQRILANNDNKYRYKCLNIPLFFFLFPLSLFLLEETHAEPKDLSLNTYEQVRQRIEMEVDKLAEQQFKSRKEDIQSLMKPFTLWSNITITLTPYSKNTERIQGRLYKIELNRSFPRIQVGLRWVHLHELSEWDRYRIEAIEDPKILELKTKPLYEELDREIKKWKGNKKEDMLEKAGYDFNFFAKYIKNPYNGHFASRKNLGEDTIRLVVELNSINNFVKCTLYKLYLSSETMVTILFKNKPIASSTHNNISKGKKDPFQWERLEFFFHKPDLGKDAITSLQKNLYLLCHSFDNHYFYQLIPHHSIGVKQITNTSNSIFCPECLGKGSIPGAEKDTQIPCPTCLGETGFIFHNDYEQTRLEFRKFIIKGNQISDKPPFSVKKMTQSSDMIQKYMHEINVIFNKLQNKAKADRIERLQSIKEYEQEARKKQQIREKEEKKQKELAEKYPWQPFSYKIPPSQHQSFVIKTDKNDSGFSYRNPEFPSNKLSIKNEQFTVMNITKWKTAHNKDMIDNKRHIEIRSPRYRILRLKAGAENDYRYLFQCSGLISQENFFMPFT